jgi:hypothetical protein
MADMMRRLRRLRVGIGPTDNTHVAAKVASADTGCSP